jgi:hypothetical protein
MADLDKGTAAVRYPDRYPVCAAKPDSPFKLLKYWRPRQDSNL